MNRYRSIRFFLQQRVEELPAAGENIAPLVDLH